MTITKRVGLIAAAATVIVGAIVGLVIVFGPSEPQFTPALGSLATTREEENLLLMHEAYGTLTPGAGNYDKLQRAILASARTLCDQLDRDVITAELSTALAAREGVQDAAVYTDFAISAMCPEHKDK